ncbi:hypothetical protein [Romboutsia sp. 1001713B170207_170306_H8]|nr:hypothetical protein [Romboutsia sp. 1001713B170207_170306_H8]SCH41892.1 Uncharacterised protein [uncultured Clostridium sp.]
MGTYNKIVRNNIPDMLKELGKRFDYEILEEEKALEALYLNLIATIYDGLDSKSLSDIVESIDLLTEIGKEYGYSEEEINNFRNTTKKEKGDFSKKIFLKKTY